MLILDNGEITFNESSNKFVNNYFTIHLEEAIEINRERSPLYSELTEGRSKRFSRKLIFLEKLTKLIAIYYDKKSYQFQREGIPVGRYEFESMVNVLPFSANYPEGLSIFKSLPQISHQRYSSNLKKYYSTKDYEQLIEYSLKIHGELKAFRAHYVMYRHFIESIIRICQMTLIHQHKITDEKMAKKQFKLNHFLLWSHLFGMKAAYDFDRDVFVLQKEGVPFLFQDLPIIHPLEDLNEYPNVGGVDD